MNKYKSLLVVGLLYLSGCSLFSSSPSSVVKKLMADSWKGDVDAMVKPWSQKAIEEEGLDQIRRNAEGFVKIQQEAKAGGEDMRVEKIRETIQGDRARVFFLYRDSKGRDSVGMGFALVKEDGQWKLYRPLDIGEEEQPFDSSFAPRKSPKPVPTPDAGTSPTLIAPPPPPTANSNSAKPASGAPIAGGVLNSKAISLPQPVYPPVARSARASGTVVVQVTYDESGRVISAKAVSGHPLLQASAEAAARNARFNPTSIGGKPVKVTGVLTYEFSAQ